jgi:TRAP-type C4-dicarboxylate transport system substrate-binding protein
MKRQLFKSLLALAAVAAFGAAQAQERTLKMNLNGPENHPAAAGMKRFAETVAAKTNGRIKINLFYNGALGSDQAVVSAIKGGTVELAVMNSGILASEAKELAIFDFPFLFANEKESDAIVDGPVGKKMHALLEPRGIVGLSYWELGYRQISNSRRPINKVEDLDQH